jgi:zinc transporter 2
VTLVIDIIFTTAKGQNPIKILNMASNEIKTRFDIYELTIQIEEYRDEMKECQQCQSPES